MRIRMRLSARDGVEIKVPGKHNNCQLRSLLYCGAPRGCCDDDQAAYRALRRRVAAFVLENRTETFNDMVVEDWVYQTAKIDVDTWAHRFAETDEMSDQIVLFIWPYMMKEAVCVWQPRGGGFEHYGAFRFTAPGLADTSCRHLVYRPDEEHYNALQIVRPEALFEGLPPKPAVVCCHLAAPSLFALCIVFFHTLAGGTVGWRTV